MNQPHKKKKPVENKKRSGILLEYVEEQEVCKSK